MEAIAPARISESNMHAMIMIFCFDMFLLFSIRCLYLKLSLWVTRILNRVNIRECNALKEYCDSEDEFPENPVKGLSGNLFCPLDK